MSTHPKEPAETEPRVVELPADFIHLLFGVLPVRDLVAASCTCKRWQTYADSKWQGRCQARWRHGRTLLPTRLTAEASSSTSSSASPQSWKKLYQSRHECDVATFGLLQAACWPIKQEHVYASLIATGADAVDALAAAAHSSCASSMFVGLTYQAHTALHYVAGDMAAQQLQHLMTKQLEQDAWKAGPAGTQQAARGSSAVAGAGAAAAADAPGSKHPPHVVTALDGALLLAQALHPLSDVPAVKRLMQQLGQELRARMIRAQAAPGSRQALTLLKQLLFGPPAAAAAASLDTACTGTGTTSAAAEAGKSAAGPAGGRFERAAPSSSVDAVRSSSSNSNGLRCSWWLRDDELDGPDLSKVVVPTDGCSGMGLRGNTSAYYDAQNSCLDSVLADGTGMPITLALLHAAVAAEADLKVEMVNMPNHVINKAWIEERMAGASAGDGRWVFIDAFDSGREMEEREIRQIALRQGYRDVLDPQLTSPGALDDVLHRWGALTAPLCLRRMLLNLVNSLKLAYAAHSGRLHAVGGTHPRPPLHVLHMRTISVALLAVKLIPVTSTQIGEAFDVFVQIVQLVGLDQVTPPPGGVLLMKKIMQIMPPVLRAWKVKLEMMLDLYIQSQREQHCQVHMRSSHPSVQLRVGQRVVLRCPNTPDRTGYILSWSVTPTAEPEPGHGGSVAGREAAAAAGVVAAAIAAVGGQPSTPDPARSTEHVRFRLLMDDFSIERDVPPCHILCQHCLQRPCDASGLGNYEGISCKKEQQRQFHIISRAWFDRSFLEDLSQGAAWPPAYKLDNWPEQHMALGQFFDAVNVNGPLAVANAPLRAMFPQG